MKVYLCALTKRLHDMSVTQMPETINVLAKTGITTSKALHYQETPEQLSKTTISRGEGQLNDTGALLINTGEFTGRSPKDKFCVKDEITADTIYWNEFNIATTPEVFDNMHQKLLKHLSEKELWIRDSYVCADPKYRLNIRVVNENPWSNLFAHNMFLRPTENELENFTPEWIILHAPNFHADPAVDGTRQHNFAMTSFTKKIILIGGTGYTGEIKKGIFTILNFILPHQKNVLSMHCSANVGVDGDTAIFFGLSGTGKTTLSADPNRKLIGDDEHGWTDDTVFNFEGGCYAKMINLSAENEPEIYNAIRPGALVENVGFLPGTNKIDFANKEITENTRISYPLNFISNVLKPSIGKTPQNIFFLTADSYGIFPPISKLTAGQAMYQFISGYTAKVAGTEAGVKEPSATFSACFGAPFLPLHPGKYAAMLGKKMTAANVNVFMINTGWSGGPYGIGSRMKLAYTRAMITAALEGKLDNVEYEAHPIFGMMMPKECQNVPSKILNPRNTWADKNAYDEKAVSLAKQFVKNFEKYASGVSEEILAAAPLIN